MLTPSALSRANVYPWDNDWDPSKLMSAEWHAQRSLVDFEAWSQWQYDIGAGSVEIGPFPEGVSPYGALDMAGKVWEWVADWYDPGYYSKSLFQNPTVPIHGSARVLRRGAWDVPRVAVFSWIRETFIPPEFASSMETGFRCAASSGPNEPGRSGRGRAALSPIEDGD